MWLMAFVRLVSGQFSFFVISKEIKLIEDYIQLEELRYSDRLTITFKKEIDNLDKDTVS